MKQSRAFACVLLVTSFQHFMQSVCFVQMQGLKCMFA